MPKFEYVNVKLNPNCYFNSTKRCIEVENFIPLNNTSPDSFKPVWNCFRPYFFPFGNKGYDLNPI